MIEESCLKGRLSAHSLEAWWKGARCTRAHEDPCRRRLWQGGLLLLLLVAQISYLPNRHTGRNPGGRYDWLRKYPHTGSQYIGRKGWCKMCMHLTMAMPPTCQNVSYIARLYLKNGYRGEGRCYVWPWDQTLNLNVAISRPRLSTCSCSWCWLSIYSLRIVDGQDKCLSIID